MKRRIISMILAFLSVSIFADVKVVVTASRIEEDSKTTPAYVRVIPKEEISKETTVLDVLKTIPDISIRETSPAKQSVSMGGFGDGSFGRTLILVNGKPVNRPDMAAFDLNTIVLSSVNRIEIVKGAMSSLYGDQAIAGVINIITKQPEGISASVSTSITSTLTNTQSISASCGSKTAGIALGINRSDKNPARDRSDSSVISANIDTFYDLKRVKTKLKLNYSTSEYQLPGGLTKAQYNDDPDQAVNQYDEGSSDSYGVTGSAAFSVGSINVFMPLAYSVEDYSSDMTSWSSFSDTLIGTLSAGLQADGSFFAGDSTEITASGGIDFRQHNLSISKYSDAEQTTKTVENELTRNDSAFWARAKANYSDRFIFDGGLRYNYSDLDSDPEVTHNALVYDAGIVYIVSPNIDASFRYGKVFRYPFLDEQASYYSGPVTVNMDLNPETGDSYTLAVRYGSGPFSISAAPYLINMEDEIMYNSGTWQNENMGSTTHYGAALESSYSKGIIGFSAGYSYDHAEFTDTEKIIPRVPAHTIYAKVSVSPVKSFTVITDGRYSSEYYIDDGNAQDTISGRFDWNVRVDWRLNNNFHLYAAGKNLLNDRTPTLTYWGSWTSQKSLYPMPGRTFEAGLKWAY